MADSRHFFRQRAIARRRDPEQDARNEAAMTAMRTRVAAHLAQSPLLQQMNAAATGQRVGPADAHANLN